ncbi:(d)CMP kinase [Microvirga thermotolerans]|uniref:Cytidylate kinase n=1 Tax=Microvirga thermotolerans TaxID=2651334 RepID=A0A5P9K1Q8_9HYPH|nr:(d)CMP kinase [Microvirga thermotolerans]QFU17545.1 (d)CMP kinase [Microvirga thermotolerans]
MIIAIDGPAASGKGTLGKRLADHLGFAHLDTGLLYRAVAAVLLARGIPLSDREAAARAAESLDVSHLDAPDLRGAAMGEAASVISAYQPVRDALLAFQRQFGRQEPGAVLDGRDIGTVVCPDADVKLFITARPEERARRRHLELLRRGEDVAYETILADIRRRDERDMTRPTAPLKAAADAITLDTTNLDADAAFRAALAIIDGKLRKS